MTWGNRCCTFTPGSCTMTGLYPLSKLNAPGLSARKWTKPMMMMMHGRVDGSCKSHSMTMCSQVWTSASPHRQLVGRWGKNLCLYSPMGACPVVMRVNRAHSEFVKPMKGSHDPPLAYVGLMTCCFSFSKLRKYWPFLGLSVKDSCHSWRILLHSFFLLNKCDSLLGKTGVHLPALTWLSTSWCLGHLALLGQYQKWILFLPSFLRKVSTAKAIGIKMFWRGSTLDSRIFLVAVMESVMTVRGQPIVA